MDFGHGETNDATDTIITTTTVLWMKVLYISVHVLGAADGGSAALDSGRFFESFPSVVCDRRLCLI